MFALVGTPEPPGTRKRLISYGPRQVARYVPMDAGDALPDNAGIADLPISPERALRVLLPHPPRRHRRQAPSAGGTMDAHRTLARAHVDVYRVTFRLVGAGEVAFGRETAGAAQAATTSGMSCRELMAFIRAQPVLTNASSAS